MRASSRGHCTRVRDTWVVTGPRDAYSLYHVLSNIRVWRYCRWHGHGTGRGLRWAQFACSSMKVPANRFRISSLNHVSKNPRFESFHSLQIVENALSLHELFLNKVKEHVVGGALKLIVLVLFFPTSYVLGLCQDPAPRPKMVERRVAGSRVKTLGL